MRKWSETVKPWPAFKADTWYQVVVMNMEKVKTPKAVAVTLRHCEREQEGRVEVMELSLPIRASGLPATPAAGALA